MIVLLVKCLSNDHVIVVQWYMFLSACISTACLTMNNKMFVPAEGHVTGNICYNFIQIYILSFSVMSQIRFRPAIETVDGEHRKEKGNRGKILK